MVGSRFNKSNGHARVYRWTDDAWAQLGSDIAGVASGDRFGRPVALSADGDTLVVGAYLNDGNGQDSGQVRVFGWT